MNDITNNHILVLGATGKTGSRVAEKLINQGVVVRTAVRSRADIRFDWNDRSTFASALDKVSAVYLVSPVMCVNFADIVARFLDEAERAGGRHVTYLSAYGMEHAPAEVSPRRCGAGSSLAYCTLPFHRTARLVHAELQRDVRQACER
jgi:nucleoside-diphosphate-sugar epimerase